MMALENLLVRTKRSIQGDGVEVALDGVIIERFDDAVTPTKNPVEFGAEISDHAIIEPKFYSFDGVVTNTPLGLTGIRETAGNIVDAVTGLFGSSTDEGLTRAQAAYRDLLTIQRNREPIDVQTGLNLIRNLLITRISTARTKDTSGALFFTMDLEEIIIVETDLVERSGDTMRGNERMGAATPTNQGRQLQQAAQNDQQENSWLISGARAFGVLD